MQEELEHWGPGRIRLRCSTSLEEPLFEMDDRQEAKKWEHLEELHLWMKHVLGLMSDIVNNGLGLAFFVRALLLFVISSLSFCRCIYHLVLPRRT
jgi:hypothetical protein